MSIIKRQTILSTFYSYIGVFFGLITQGYLIPKFFTTQQNGLMAILLGWMYIICQIGSLGFNHAGTKYFPFFRDDKTKHKGYLNLGLKFNIVGLLICIILLYLFKDLIVETNLNNKVQASDSALFRKYFFVLIPISLGTILFNLFDNYAKGLYDSVAGSFFFFFLQRFFLFIVCLGYAFQYFDFNTFMYFCDSIETLPK